jgi:hypothetical protein
MIAHSSIRLFAVGAFSCAFATAAQAEAGPLRLLPYPFEHMVTISSDVDAQPAWYGSALHHRMNDALGLQIADSFWVSANVGAGSSSSLFRSIDQRNDSPSEIAGRSVFRLLLRDFHRGNYDQLHSWQNDGLPEYRFVPPQPLLIGNSSIRVDLPRIAFFDSLWQNGEPQPVSFRLIFDTAPSDALQIELVGSDGRPTMVPAEAIRRGPSLQPQPLHERVLEVVMTSNGARDTLAYRGQPAAIMLSDAAGQARLIRVEWDGFSRTLVQRQLPTLERFNIRPVLSSAHGGFTRAQNFGPKEPYKLTPFGDADLVRSANWTARAAGDDPSSHAYHADILRQLGVTSIAPIPPVDYPYTVLARPTLEPLSTSAFWKVDKTWGLSTMPPISAEKLAAQLMEKDPVAAKADISGLLCTDNMLCLRSEQGRTLGYAIATSLAHIEAGESVVEHNWYQHFGTALEAPGPSPSVCRPFVPEVEFQLWRLSDYAYNWSGTVLPLHRVWTPSPSVWQTYRISRSNLASNIAVNPITSEISLRRASDPVLNRPWPSLLAPMRELHGLTIYVPDAASASVVLDGERLTSFTRNAADATGRQSVTLVNDAFPITVLGHVAPEAVGATVSKAFRLETGQSGSVRLFALGRSPQFTVVPENLSFWNISHLRLVGMQSGRGRLWLRFNMASGARIVLSEPGAAPPPHDASLQLPEAPRDSSATRIVSLSELRTTRPIPAQKDPPLPLGRIRSVDIGLSDAEYGSRVSITDLAGLQALAAAPAPDGSVVVSGRVLDRGGNPLTGSTVTLQEADDSRHEALTDASGYYDFFGLKRGQAVSVSAQLDTNAQCAPMRGWRFWLSRDEVEIDIDAGACR